MKTLSIFIITLFFCLTSFAQQSEKIVKTIKGKVVNATTNEPVSYTNIGLLGTYFGTASNAEGDFELKITEEMTDLNIYFSAVGFANRKFPVNTLFDKAFNVIKIEPLSYGIDDVDVEAQSRVLVRILTTASEDIPNNFAAGPFNMEGKYTNKKIIDDTVSVVQNADILIYDQSGYSNPSKLNAYKNLKYSLKKDQWDIYLPFSGETTNIDELLDLDWVRSAFSILNPKILAGFQLKLESEQDINGQKCWIISFSQEKPALAGSGDFYATGFEGKITIAQDNYSVLNIEGKVISPKNNRQGRSLATGNSSKRFYENVSYQFSMDYTSLRPEKFSLKKEYTFNGRKVSENATLQINQIGSSNLQSIVNRDYFIGE